MSDRIYVSTTSAWPPRLWGKEDSDFIFESDASDGARHALTSGFPESLDIPLVSSSVSFPLSGKGFCADSISEPFGEGNRWLLVFYPPGMHEFRISDPGTYVNGLLADPDGNLTTERKLEIRLTDHEMEKISEFKEEPIEILADKGKMDFRCRRPPVRPWLSPEQRKKIARTTRYKLFVVSGDLLVGVFQGRVS